MTKTRHGGDKCLEQKLVSFELEWTRLPRPRHQRYVRCQIRELRDNRNPRPKPELMEGRKIACSTTSNRYSR